MWRKTIYLPVPQKNSLVLNNCHFYPHVNKGFDRAIFRERHFTCVHLPKGCTHYFLSFFSAKSGGDLFMFNLPETFWQAQRNFQIRESQQVESGCWRKTQRALNWPIHYTSAEPNGKLCKIRVQISQRLHYTSFCDVSREMKFHIVILHLVVRRSTIKFAASVKLTHWKVC